MRFLTLRDEGWTVRCDIAPAEKIWLEVDLYAE